MKLLVVLFLAIACLPLAAEPAKPSPKAPTLPAGVRLEKDVPYVSDGDEAQRLDLYLPQTPPQQPLPLIVHIHGGGWRAGNRYPCPVAAMAQHGYIVASIGYRFSQKAVFPAQIQDCQAAIRWLRAHALRHHIDPERVGVIGGSAGGHLSALVGTAGGKRIFTPIGGHEDQSDRVQAVCDIYGPTDFSTVVEQAAADPNVKNVFQFNTPSDPYSSLIGAPLHDQAKTDVVSPVRHVSADCPPFLIFHGTHDALVPYAQSLQFEAALKGKGVPVWLQTLPGAGHGGPAFVQPAIVQLTRTFFDKHLKGLEVEIQLVPPSLIRQEMPKPAAR